MFVWTLHGCGREWNIVQLSGCKSWLQVVTLGLWLRSVKIETSSAHQVLLLC